MFPPQSARCNPFHFDRIANFRDCAACGGASADTVFSNPNSAPRKGLEVKSGQYMQKGLLYRSGLLTQATEADIARVSKAVRTYIDLRNPTDDGLDEGRAFDHFSPSPRGRVTAGSTGVRISVDLGRGPYRKPAESRHRPNRTTRPKLERTEVDAQTGRKILRKEFVAILLRNGLLHQAAHNGDLVVQILRVLTKPESYPVVFGCQSGKDRTGLISAVVLGALGASDEAIVDDYLVSSGAQDANFYAVGESAKEHARNSGGLDRTQAEVQARAQARKGATAERRSPPEGSRRMFDCYESTIREFIAWIKAQYGGWSGYLHYIGFAPEELASLRRLLLIDPAPSRL